jgi:hypothetical protein
MNLHEFILERSLADTDPRLIAISYVTAVLKLGDVAEQVAALEPSVRPHASRLASAQRRALRGGPAHAIDDSQVHNGGPAQKPNDGHTRDGGPAHNSSDSQDRHGGPAPAWAAGNASLIAYCRDHQSDHYWIPGAGRRKLAEITADEWLARARWLGQQAEGAAKSAARSRAFASLIQAAGGQTLADVLEVTA